MLIREVARRVMASSTPMAFAIGTLGIAIGGATAAYAAVYAAALRPLQIPDVARVGNVYHSDPRQNPSVPQIGLSLPDFEDFLAQQTFFSQVTALSPFRVPLEVGGQGETVWGEAVTSSYFSFVGVAPLLGRPFHDADDQVEAPAVALVSEGFWRQNLGAEKDVLGKRIDLNGVPFEVVGVIPGSFRGLFNPTFVQKAVWIPLRQATRIRTGLNMLNRDRRWILAKGRLREGYSFAQGHAQLSTIAARLDAEYPLAREGDGQQRATAGARGVTPRAWQLVPAQQIRVNEAADFLVIPLATAALTGVCLTLLVACTNLANLQLAYGASRRQTVAVQHVLGASWMRLLGVECGAAAVTMCCGYALGLVVARLLILYVLSGDIHIAPGLTLHFAPALDTPAIAASGVFAAVAFVSAGFLPALRLSAPDLRLLSSPAGYSVQSWRGRKNLIAVQVATSVALVSITSLSVKELLVAQNEKVMDTTRLGVLRLELPSGSTNAISSKAAFAQMVQLAHQGQVVEDIAVASSFPSLGTAPRAYVARNTQEMFFNERVYGKPAQYIVCSAEAERLFALGVLRGRFVSDSDGKGAMPVAVISEALARDVFGRIDVIGESIDIVQQPSDERGHAPVERRTLIGVAADVHTQSPGKTAIVYVPYEQDSSASLGLIVKARGDVVNAVRSLADAARRSFPGVLVLAQESADSLLGSHLLAVRVAAWVSGVLGTVSLLLAMTGLYGILATQVSQRTRELGIRLALGAAPSQIKSMVVGEGIRPVVEGALIGIVLGNLSRSVVGPALTGKISSTFDVSWTTEVLIGLSLVAVCATIIPASRAAAVEPLVALRDL